VHAHDDLFAQDVEDDVWLAEVGRKNELEAKAVNRRGEIRHLYP
jgi:hypothetical protein